MTIGTYFQPEQLIFLDESVKDERTSCRLYMWSKMVKNKAKNQKSKNHVENQVEN